MSHSHAKSIVTPPDALNLVALDIIDVRPQIRTRFDKQGLAELAESVKANGILAPVLLRPNPKKPGRFELIAGERRVRAAKAAGLTHIPAISGQADDQARVRMQLAENLDREDLDEREVCAAVKALFDREKDIGKVAALVKRSKPWVCKHLGPAMNWPYDAVVLFEEGKCEDLELLGSYAQLVKLAGSYPAPISFPEISAIGKKVSDGKITRDELRELTAAAKKKQREGAGERKAAEQRRTVRAKEKAAKPPAPEQIAEELLESAEYEGDELNLEREFAKYEPTAIAAAEATQREAYDDGVKARAGAKTPEAMYAILGSRLIGWETWLAGFCGVPFSLEALCKARAMAAQYDQDAEDDDD